MTHQYFWAVFLSGQAGPALHWPGVAAFRLTWRVFLAAWRLLFAAGRLFWRTKPEQNILFEPFSAAFTKKVSKV